MKNVVKCYKHFFGYFNALKNHGVLFTVFAKKNFICRILGREAKALVFADSSTYSGRDDNPLFDEDDELALMARHLGPRVSHTTTKFPKNVQQVCIALTLWSGRSWGY